MAEIHTFNIMYLHTIADWTYRQSQNAIELFTVMLKQMSVVLFTEYMLWILTDV